MKCTFIWFVMGGLAEAKLLFWVRVLRRKRQRDTYLSRLPRRQTSGLREVIRLRGTATGAAIKLGKIGVP